jgi:hypothetical protein
MLQLSSRCRVAQVAPDLRAMLGVPRPLHYDRGDDAATNDLPPYVRAASAIRRRGARLVVVQDDTLALAVVDPAAGSIEPVLLPYGPDGARVFDDLRGNKAFKLDLEACVALPDGRLVALGSGSSPRRERIVVLAAPAAGSIGDTCVPTIVDASDWYAELRSHAEAHGAELNVEGVVIHGARVRVVQRGHGKRPDTHWNAMLDYPLEAFLDWLDRRGATPRACALLEVRIGASRDGIPFGFTDAAVLPDGSLAFLACAEDSIDVRSDGPVVGCRFGWIDPDDLGVLVTDVLGPDGRPTMLKLEGIEARLDDPRAFDVVADMDRPEEPAVHAELRVDGIGGPA